MKAAVYHGPNKVEVADVPEPDPRPGTVQLKVGFNGICGTDLHEYYAGPIGIGLWFALRGKGIEDVFVVEPSVTRRAAIEALGARTALLPSSTAPLVCAARLQQGVSGASAGAAPARRSAE